MSKENLKDFPEGLIVITPNDPGEVLKGAQPVHVGLNIREIYSEDAEILFGRFRLHLKPGRTYNLQQAATLANQFKQITEISPMDILETVSEIELSHGFTTLHDH